MANLVSVEATALLNASFGKVTYPAPTTPMMLRLLTAVGDATTPGTEVVNSGGSTYAPQNLSTALANASSGSITNSAAVVTFTNMPPATVTGVAIWDSSGTPVRKWFGALTAAKSTGQGDTLSFALSTISATLQ